MTDFRELRIGHGALRAMSGEQGRALVFADPAVRNLVERYRLPAAPEAVVEATTLDGERLDEICRAAPAADRVIGLGGGTALDGAKYAARKLELPLVVVPTILSTTAYVNSLIALRRDGRHSTVEGPPADLVLIDLDVLMQGPRAMNVAGLGDLLSCHTAIEDWRLAWRNGVTDLAWDPRAVGQASLLIDSIAQHADEFQAMTERAIRLLVQMHVEIVDICAALGHERVEQGSEHFLCHTIERRTGRPFLHGQIIGLGIDVMSQLQGNGHVFITQLMQEVGLDFSPAAVGVSRAELADGISALRAGATELQPWPTVIDYVELDRSQIAELLDARTFSTRGFTPGGSASTRVGA